MNEKTFLKIAIFTSLVGILILLFIVETTEIPLSKISEITNDKLYQQIKIQGVISSIKSTASSTILTISDVTSSIKVSFFSQNVGLYKGDYIEVTGKVQEYQNNLEILASEIKKL